MLLNAPKCQGRVFIVSELLRENQQRGGGEGCSFQQVLPQNLSWFLS